MSYWNHRVVQLEEGKGFEIREVYYNEDGSIYATTEDGVSPFGETIGELEQDLKSMRKALKEAVLVEPIKYVPFDKDPLNGADNE